VLLHEILRERLAPLQAGRRGSGPYDRMTGLFESINDACNERLLGPNDGEVDRVLLGDSQQPIRIVHRAGHVITNRRCAGVARSRYDVIDAGAAGQRAGQSVLAPAAADNQYSHGNLLSL